MAPSDKRDHSVHVSQSRVKFKRGSQAIFQATFSSFKSIYASLTLALWEVYLCKPNSELEFSTRKQTHTHLNIVPAGGNYFAGTMFYCGMSYIVMCPFSLQIRRKYRRVSCGRKYRLAPSQSRGNRIPAFDDRSWTAIPDRRPKAAPGHF